MGIKFQKTNHHTEQDNVSVKAIQIGDLNIVPDPYASVVSVSPNGTIQIQSEQDPIFLGRYKEQNLRGVYIDISNLLIEDIKIDNIVNCYEASLIIRQGKERQIVLKSTSTFNDCIVFVIPDIVTAVQGEYELIFTLKEKTEDGNVHHQIEWFTSSIFKGVVLPSMADDFETGNFINLETKEGLLQKPTIQLDWLKNNIFFIDPKMILGYTQDKYITELKLRPSNLITDKVYNTYIVLTNKVTKITFNHKLTNNTSFLTKEVTNKPGIWYISVAIIGETQKLFSNFLPIEVVDNTLTNTPELRTINLNSIKDVDHSQIQVKSTDPLMPLYHTLEYTGKELDNILDTINSGLKPDSWLLLQCGNSKKK